MLESRSQVVRCLIAALTGLLNASLRNVSISMPPEPIRKRSGSSAVVPNPSPSIEATQKDGGLDDRASRRTKVTPDTWQDSLSLLCDMDFAIRKDYVDALTFYLVNELPKTGSEQLDSDGVRRIRRLTDSQQFNLSALLRTGDMGMRFLNAIHAYLYLLVISTSFNVPPNSASMHDLDIPQVNVLPATPEGEGSASGEVQLNANASHLLEHASSSVSSMGAASLSDFTIMHHVLSTIQEQLSVRGLLTTVPMLLALDAATLSSSKADPLTIQRANVLKLVIAKIWLQIGKIWTCSEVIALADDVCIISIGYYLL
jgi:protein EFR3